MRYTILGAGALGSLLGARLHHHGVDVELVDDDPARLERLRRPIAVRGYRLGPATTVPVASWEQARRECDVLFMCVPPARLGDALARARSTFTQAPPMVAFSGGIAVLEALAGWPGERIHAVANLEVRLNAEGEPETGFHNFIYVGNRDASETDAMRQVQRDLVWVAPTLTTKVIEGMVWSKAIFELEAALPVLAGVAPRELFDRPDGVACASALVREALGVANVAGATPIAFDFFDPNLYHVATAGERATLEAWIRHAWQRHEQYRVGASDTFTEPAGLGWSLDPRNPGAELGTILGQLRGAAQTTGQSVPRLDWLAQLLAGEHAAGRPPVGVQALVEALGDEVPA